MSPEPSCQLYLSTIGLSSQVNSLFYSFCWCFNPLKFLLFNPVLSYGIDKALSFLQAAGLPSYFWKLLQSRCSQDIISSTNLLITSPLPPTFPSSEGRLKCIKFKHTPHLLAVREKIARLYNYYRIKYSNRSCSNYKAEISNNFIINFIFIELILKIFSIGLFLADTEC